MISLSDLLKNINFTKVLKKEKEMLILKLRRDDKLKYIIFNKKRYIL